MKRIILILLIVFASISLLNAQNKLIKFHKYAYDFGQIKEENGEHIHNFRFKNISKGYVKIDSVTTSCGCTMPIWPKDSVAAGDSATIKAMYNAFNRPGTFDKTLTVYVTQYTANDTIRDTISLNIKGNVKPKLKDPRKELPELLGAVRVYSRYINLDRINSKDIVTREFAIYNDTTFDITLKAINPQPNYMKILVEPAVLKPHQKGVIKVSYDAKVKNDLGYVSDYFEIETNEQTQKSKLFYVSATIDEYFPPMTEAQVAMAPKIALDRKELDFGTVKAGDLAQGSFIITNTGKQDLIIRKSVASCGCTASVPEKNTIAPGETTKVNVTFNSSDRSGPQSKTVTIFSNDPTAPVQYITIKAYVIK